MKRALIALGGVAAIGLGALLVTGVGQDNVQAADHGDSPATSVVAQQDITDHYAWTWDNAGVDSLALVMNVDSGTTAAGFAAGTQFVFHIDSTDGTNTETNQVVCEFASGTDVTCYIGNSATFARVNGDPSGATGFTDATSGAQIFAGPRNDPFFFNQSGIVATFTAVQATCNDPGDGTCPDIPFVDGCAQIDGATAATLRGLLTSDGVGGAAADDLAGTNVLSLVVSVPLSLINGGGDTLRTWASTHTAP